LRFADRRYFVDLRKSRRSLS